MFQIGTSDQDIYQPFPIYDIFAADHFESIPAKFSVKESMIIEYRGKHCGKKRKC